MRTTECLLGRRFRYNGKNTRYARWHISLEGRKYIERLRQDIKNGRIKQGQHSSCPLCGHENAFLIAEIDRVGLPCKTVICKGCGFVFNDSFFDEGSIEILYKEYYGKINHSKLSAEEYFLKRTSPYAPSWKRFAFVLLRLGNDLKSINTVFEIGCRDGCNLLPFFLSGKEVVGCDFDEECLAVGRKRGLNLIYGSMDSLLDIGEKADLLILSHVFTLFIDLDKIISVLKKILNPGGYVYVEVPGLMLHVRPRSDYAVEDGWARSSNNFLLILQSIHNYYFDLEKVSAFFEKNRFSKIYGDELVCVIFRNTEGTGLKKNSGYNIDSPDKILRYFQTVERDYRSFGFQAGRVIRKLMS